MHVVYFTHSLISCWNHGNAHFLRGVLRELVSRGHDVTAYEPAQGWSRTKLIAAHGTAPVAAFARRFPELRPVEYGTDLDVAGAVDGADLVIVHEWNEPCLVSALGRARRRGGRFLLLFHDTHHRAVSDPEVMRGFALDAYDGVLAFGDSLAEVYRRWGWGSRVFVWHEAADTRLFRPPEREEPREGLVWVGNWGDGERGEELQTLLLDPAAQAGLPPDVYGVRYPDEALDALARKGARYRGWLPNVEVPSIFARHLATAHVPRRFYADRLPGIPTIRVFEALACGIPLVSTWAADTEHLFQPGEDFLVARNPIEMREHLRALKHDPALRTALAASGLRRIDSRHTCAHRADELLAIAARLSVPEPA
jgi:spore maturation protein CgeB